VPSIARSQIEWIGLLEGLNPAWGVIFIVVGLVYVLLGWRIFKVLLILNCAGFGATLGAELGWAVFGESLFWPLVLGLVGGVALGAAAGSLFRLAATLCAALVGGFVGAHLAGLFSIAPDMHLVGAVAGALLTGSLVFVAFEHIVIVVLSFQGGVMAVAGMVLATSQETGFLRYFHEMATRSSLVAPFCIIALTVIGTSLQLGGLRSGGASRSK
jgi:hypothetical protein